MSKVSTHSQNNRIKNTIKSIMETAQTEADLDYMYEYADGEDEKWCNKAYDDAYRLYYNKAKAYAHKIHLNKKEHHDFKIDFKYVPKSIKMKKEHEYLVENYRHKYLSIINDEELIDMFFEAEHEKEHYCCFPDYEFEAINKEIIERELVIKDAYGWHWNNM